MNFPLSIERCYAFGLNVALQSTLLLVIAGITLAFARKTSAARRHLIAISFLATLLLLPLMDCALPGRWSVAGLAKRIAIHSNSSNSDRHFTPSGDGASKASPGPSAALDPFAQTHTSPVLKQTWTGSTRSSASVQRDPGQYPIVLLLIWLVGSALLWMRIAVSVMRLFLISRRCQGVKSAYLHALLSGIQSKKGEYDRIRVVECSAPWHTPVPVTWGIRRPVLMLPEAWEEWSESSLRSALLHELAHIRRRDWLLQFMANVVCAVYWFHPLAWGLNRRMQMEAEESCDDMVLMAGIPATEYAGSLLEVVRRVQKRRGVALGAVAMATRGQVTTRIQAILLKKRPRHPMGRTGLVFSFLAATLLAISSTCVWPVAAQTESDATGHSSSTEDNKTGTSDLPGKYGPVISLDNGVKIELIAIGHNTGGWPYGDDWWSDRGVLLPEVPLFHRDLEFHRRYGNTFPTGVVGYGLWFRLYSPTDQEVSTTGYVVDPSHRLAKDIYHLGRDIKEDHVKLSQEHPASGAVTIGLPPDQAICTYRFGVATGSWETAGVVKLPEDLDTKMGLTITLDGHLTATFRSKHKVIVTRSLLNSMTLTQDVAYRLIGRDQDGREVDLGEPQDHMGGDPTLSVDSPQLERIVEFQLQTRPYQWAEFKDLTLKPHRTAAPVATPATRPGYSHTFASGYKIDFLGVTEPRSDGGAWWGPDGRKYRGPLKEYVDGEIYGSSVDFRYLDTMTRRRALLIGESGRIRGTYNEAWQLIPDPASRLWHGLQREEEMEGSRIVLPYPRSISCAYAPDVREITLRWGVATSPWKTVATLPMPTDIKHHIDPTHRGGDQDISLHYPFLSYETRSGERRKLPLLTEGHSAEDVAVRFIAVDKQNRRIPLNTSAENGNDHWVILSFQKDSMFHMFNRIDLNTIKEFQLQTRPYEWVTFKHIRLDPIP